MSKKVGAAGHLTEDDTTSRLGQEFNLLQAQREAFINSQRHEGWVYLPGAVPALDKHAAPSTGADSRAIASVTWLGDLHRHHVRGHNRQAQVDKIRHMIPP